MNEWRGRMNWPLDEDWVCETCRGRILIWGFVHGTCRCDTCHTQYAMRVDGEHVTCPKSRLKEEYKAPAQAGWKHTKKPISTWDDELWDWAFAECIDELDG